MSANQDSKKEGLSKKELNKLAKKERKKEGGAVGAAPAESQARLSVLFSKSSPPNLTRAVEVYLRNLLHEVPAAPSMAVRYCINKNDQVLHPLLFTSNSIGESALGRTESGTISGDAAIARFLVRSAAVGMEFAAVSAVSTTPTHSAGVAPCTAVEESVSSLYGRDDPWLASQIDQWVDQATLHCAGMAKDSLQQLMSVLNDHLADKTYLVGFDFTLADIAMQVCLRNSNSSDTGVLIAQGLQEHFPHAFRWFEMASALLAPAPGSGDAASIPVSFNPAAAAIAAKAAGGSSKGTGVASAGGSGAARGSSNSGGEKKKKGNDTNNNQVEGNEGDIGSCPPLEGAEEGKVCTRFPPEPSGYLHIGHAKACLLNQYYAERYKGKLLVRFDDTNPSKEKEEFQENILADLATLGVIPHKVSHSSDYFEQLQEAARKLLKEGKAFMDNTDQETMQAERLARTESKHRNNSVDENLKWFDEMLKGTPSGKLYCMRAKIDMSSVNGTMRDPVLYRFNDTPHHRTGSKYKAYPTYDFACPLIDAWEGVTHALRTTEYNDRDEQYHFIQKAAGVRHVHIHAFGKMNFIHTVLSKRKLTWFVEQGLVEGWFDPRFPTIQGCVRRGIDVSALKNFIISQGASRRVITMEWDKFWSENKKVLEEKAPRYMGVTKLGMVELHITNVADEITAHTVPLHPQKPEMGTRVMRRYNKVYIDQQDAVTYKVGEEVTLLRWGNVTITEIERVSHEHEAVEVISLKATHDPTATNFSKTKKVTWIAAIPDLVPCRLVEFDHLISKPKLGEEDKFQDYLNPVTMIESDALCDPCLRTVQVGTVLQLERKGFFRCDKAYGGSPAQPAVLFMIPDGKARSISPLNNLGGAADDGKKKKNKK